MEKRVLIRCDASPTLGHGHLVRCLALAEALVRAGDLRPEFAVLGDDAAARAVAAAGHVCHRATDAESDEGEWLLSLVKRTGADALVCDVRTGLSPAALEAVRDLGVLVAVIDDPAPRRLAADLAFYPPVSEVERLDWVGFGGRRFVGWDWLVLRAGFSGVRRRVRALNGRRVRTLVAMGGSDPAGLTLKALAGLEPLAAELEVAVVLGGGFCHEAALAAFLAESKLAPVLHRAVTDMPGLMGEMDLAVASFGMTAYELAAIGVPAVHLCLTEGHASAAQSLVEAGQATSLGLHGEVGPEQIAAEVRAWLGRIRVPQFELERVIDGQGAMRIARCLAESVLTPAAVRVSP